MKNITLNMCNMKSCFIIKLEELSNILRGYMSCFLSSMTPTINDDLAQGIREWWRLW